VDVVGELERAITSLSHGRRVLVAIDGPDAAGKTTLANRLAQTLTIPTLRASIDGFHRPREARMARGIDSPHGYYEDSFDQVALERNLLGPFARGDSAVRTRVFDFRTDSAIDEDPTWIAPACVLLFDGVFLLRPELRHWWNLSIYLHVPELVTLARAKERDSELFGSPEIVEARYRLRYLPGQSLYREEAKPQFAAHIVLDNSNPDDPVVLKWGVAI
jgi:uridine kinase